MKILITGAAGYIGSMLCHYLSTNTQHHVTGFDNLQYNQGSMVYQPLRNVDFYREDITQWSDNLKREIDAADVIIPLAALVGAPLCERYPEQAEQINYHWFCRLKEYMNNQHIIYPNTNSGYGTTGNDICTEKTPSNPISEYGQQKQKTEDLIVGRDAFKHWTCFRLATVFGWSWRPRLDLLVNNLVYDAVVHGGIILFDPNARRNYIHIKDICRAFNMAIAYPNEFGNQIYNLGNDDINCTKLELAEQISDITECFVEISKGHDPDKRDYIVSSKKIYDRGFDCYYDLADGILELQEFYKFIQKIDVSSVNFHRMRNY